MYTVERLADRGYGKVTDDRGQLVIIYPLASIPDEMMHQVLVIWRGGYKLGLREGLRRGRAIAKDTP
ncbi:hypothetical protein ACVWZK_003082 [Bradyrhizobium sp. GM0.4]